MVTIPGTNLYWAVGAWSACNHNCVRSRVVACYSAAADGSGSTAAAQESACISAGVSLSDESTALVPQ